MKESEIQRRLMKAASARGMQAWPIAFRGRRGCPDTLVMNVQRYHCLIELKKTGEVARKLQGFYHRKLGECIDVFTAAGLPAALAILDNVERRKP